MSMKNDGYGAGRGGSGWARSAFGGGGGGSNRRPPAMGPGRRVVYRPNHSKDDGFGGFILSDQMRDVTAEVARDIAEKASDLAPRSNGEGPHMADQFKVKENAGTLKVGRNVRVKVEVFNSDRASAPNEFGGQRNKRHRMLGRAGAAFGDFKPDGQEA